MSEARAAHYRACFERFEVEFPGHRLKLDQKAFMIAPWCDAMIRESKLLDVVEDLIGRDILCWGQSLRLKNPDGKTFAGWHQDTAYARVQPIVVICALALSRCRREHGCIRAIPGSHRTARLPHRENFGTDSLLTREQTIEGALDVSTAVDLELEPGECAFFYNAICHASEPNFGPDQRIVFLLEMIPTHAWQASPRESATLVRGEDRYHHWDVDRPATRQMGDRELEAWRQAVEVQAQVLFGGAERPPRALR